MRLGELGDRNFGSHPVWSRGKAPVGGLGVEVSEKLKLFTHLHIIYWTRHSRKLGCPDIVDANRLTPPLGVWGLFRQQGLGAELLFRVLVAKPPEAESFSLHKWLTFA